MPEYDPNRYSTEAYREANNSIAEKLAAIQKLYDECAEIAVAVGVEFEYDGPSRYGDGGTFSPTGYRFREAGWQASSHSC
jgi:hypothetical protein